jgi:hypothetical protein
MDVTALSERKRLLEDDDLDIGDESKRSRLDAGAATFQVNPVVIEPQTRPTLPVVLPETSVHTHINADDTAAAAEAAVATSTRVHIAALTTKTNSATSTTSITTTPTAAANQTTVANTTEKRKAAAWVIEDLAPEQQTITALPGLLLLLENVCQVAYACSWTGWGSWKCCFERSQELSSGSAQ